MNKCFGLVVYGLLAWSAPVQAQQPARENSYHFQKPSAGGTGKIYMGREISQVMGAGGMDWLERDSREKEEHTAAAINKLPLTPSSVVADIGAGSGYYSFRIAQKIPAGKLYAVEIQEEMLLALAEKKKATHATNIEIIKGDEKGTNLPSHSVDIAIMVDVYHELLYPREMLKDIHRSLKQDGKLLLLEYKGEDPSIPIRPLHKMTAAQVDKELSANGFRRSMQAGFLPQQHFLLYERK